MNQETFVRAHVIPNGSGGLVVKPKAPVLEVGTIEAAKILGISRTTLWELRHHPVAGKILKWRFTSPSRRRVVFTTESLSAYLEYTLSLEGK